MILHILYNKILLPLWGSILAGGLLGIGFIVPSLWWLCIVGIILVLHQVVSINKTATACAFAFGAWSIKSACALVWFWSAYPLDWLSIPSLFAQYSVISFYWLTSSLWLGSGGVFFALGVRYLYRVPVVPKFIWYLTIPFLWLLGELVAALVFSLFTMGPGSFIQSYFSFGQIGYLLGVTQFGLWLAGGWGVYGLTILLVYVSVVFWYLIKQKYIKQVTFFTFGGICLISIFSHFYHPQYQSQNLTVQTINTQFSSVMLGLPGGLETKTAVLEEALTTALTYPTDYILLPEDSRYFSSVFGDVSRVALASRFEFTHGSTSAVIIDSSRLDLQGGQTVLRAQIYDGRAKVIHQFDKQYLVPQGEYVPYFYGSIMRLLGFGSAVDSIARDSSYSPGPLQQDSFLPTYVPGVLFCFESVRPSGVVTLTEARQIPFVVHPISHGWFHTPVILWRQLDVMLQMQARVSGVPIVSAGNMVSGKLYLPTGEIVIGEVQAAGEQYVLRQFNF